MKNDTLKINGTDHQKVTDIPARTMGLPRQPQPKPRLQFPAKPRPERQRRSVTIEGVTYTVIEGGGIMRHGKNGVTSIMCENLLAPQLRERLRQADPWIKKVFDDGDRMRARWQEEDRSHAAELKARRDQRKKQREALNTLKTLKLQIRKDGTIRVGRKSPDKKQIRQIRSAITTLLK